MWASRARTAGRRCRSGRVVRCRPSWARFRARTGFTRGRGGWVAVNRAQGLRARFGRLGVSVGVGGSRLGLRLMGVGFGGSLARLGSVAPTGRANRVSYPRAGVDEWYANGPLGLEQGFTVAPPRSGGRGDLRLSMVLSGDLRATLSARGRSLWLGRGGRSVLAYRDLVATDQRGRSLPAWLSLHAGRLEIWVHTAAAVFPVRVDPLIQLAKLTASDGAAGDQFGISVGVSSDGSTVVAGANGAEVGSNNHQGAAYVFVKPGGGWSSGTQTAKLTASDGAAGDALGASVGVSSDGSTVVAGAPFAKVGSNGHQGAAYVFVKPAGGWSSGTQTAKLTASDGAANDGLALSVGMSGDGSTVVAGAPFAKVGSNTAQGAAYVFVKPAGGWGAGAQPQNQAAKLTASDGAAGDSLGGPSSEGGVGVSGDGSTVVAGGPGVTVGSNGRQGAAYVFVRPGGGWSSGTQTAKLTASDGAANDQLGFSTKVSADGSTVVAGAVNASVGSNSAQGAAYVFVRPGGGWSSGDADREADRIRRRRERLVRLVGGGVGGRVDGRRRRTLCHGW